MPCARKIFNRMNGTVFNNKSIRKVPINRNSLFYDEGCYNFDLEVGKDYTEQDMGQTVILYQVDASLTQANAVYGETKPNGVKFKTPIEIPCVYKIEEPELKSYDKSKNLATYVKNGVDCCGFGGLLTKGSAADIAENAKKIKAIIEETRASMKK